MTDQNRFLHNEYCVIDDDTYEKTLTLLAPPIKKTSLVDEVKTTNDLLNPRKAILQAELLSKFVDLRGKRFLEIGSGLGVNLIVWMKKFGMTGYGLEPQVDVFDSSARISKALLSLNGIDGGRITCAYGEHIPFASNSFDIVYSTNVLEHVQSPPRVLEEALRVLKPSGILQFVFPNYRSFYEGHYAVFHPPIFYKSFLPWYVRFFYGRDPSLAKTLRTELNVASTKRIISEINKRIPVRVLSLGVETFTSRMVNIDFEAWASLERVKGLLFFAKKLRLNRLAAAVMVGLKAWTPIIVTLEKK